MTEWWSYSLRDFLMFSPRTYYRLFDLYNGQFWPAQVLSTALGILLLLALTRASDLARSVSKVILSGAWLWISYAYFSQRYATIHWAGTYMAWAFALQGAALLWAAPALRKDNTAIDRILIAVLVVVVLGYPLIAIVAGRPWSQAEVFGMAPDPTAIVTLAVLALGKPRPSWFLMAIPAAWCVYNAISLGLMASPDALVLPALACIVLGATVARALGVQHHQRT